MSSNEKAPDPTPEEMVRFQENRSRVPLEHLLPFAGKHVAWSLDGLHIVACGDSMEEVGDKVVATGLAPNRVVFGYIDDPSISYLGGGLFDDSAIPSDSDH